MPYKIIGYIEKKWNDQPKPIYKDFDGYSLQLISKWSPFTEEEHEGLYAGSMLITRNALLAILNDNNWTLHDLIDKECLILPNPDSNNYILEIDFNEAHIKALAEPS